MDNVHEIKLCKCHALIQPRKNRIKYTPFSDNFNHKGAIIYLSKPHILRFLRIVLGRKLKLEI